MTTGSFLKGTCNGENVDVTFQTIPSTSVNVTARTTSTQENFFLTAPLYQLVWKSSDLLASASETATSPSSPSPTSDTESPSSESGLSTGASAGIGIGVAIMVLALATVAACLFVRRRRRQKTQVTGTASAGGSGKSQHGEFGWTELPGAKSGGQYELSTSSNLHEVPGTARVAEME